jgi:hypothetical protein
MLCIRRALTPLWFESQPLSRGTEEKFNKVMGLAEMLGLEDPIQRESIPEGLNWHEDGVHALMKS